MGQLGSTWAKKASQGPRRPKRIKMKPKGAPKCPKMFTRTSRRPHTTILSQASMKPNALRAKGGGFQGRSQDAPETVRSDVGVRSARQTPSDALSQQFFVVLSCRAKAPMCFSYQFLKCFVGFERSKRRTRVRNENTQKSRRCGLQNRARERPGDPKSSPSGPVCATKREKVARSLSIF